LTDAVAGGACEVGWTWLSATAFSAMSIHVFGFVEDLFGFIHWPLRVFRTVTRPWLTRLQTIPLWDRHYRSGLQTMGECCQVSREEEFGAVLLFPPGRNGPTRAPSGGLVQDDACVCDDGRVCVYCCSTYYKACVCLLLQYLWACVCLLLQYLLQSVCVFITAVPLQHRAPTATAQRRKSVDTHAETYHYPKQAPHAHRHLSSPPPPPHQPPNPHPSNPPPYSPHPPPHRRSQR
jgi:hypothetical protein